MKRAFLQNRLFVLIFTGMFILPLLSSPSLALASQDAFLKNIVVTNTRDDLITYFDVEGAFTDKITEAVLSGIPTSFVFFVSIYKTQPGFDRKMSETEIISTIKYNKLKEEFTVSRPWKSEIPSVTDSFEKAKALMVEIDNLKVVPLDQLKKGENYQVRIKAKMSSVTLPLYLHYILFFVALWDFETDWHTIEFVY